MSTETKPEVKMREQKKEHTYSVWMKAWHDFKEVGSKEKWEMKEKKSPEAQGFSTTSNPVLELLFEIPLQSANSLLFRESDRRALMQS